MRTDSHLASTARKTWSGLLRDGLSKRRDSRHGEDAARAREEGRAEMGEQTASLRGLNGKERTTKGWLKSLWWMEVREERQQRRELGQQGVAQAEFKISRWASLAGGPAACSLRPNLSAQPLLLTLLSLSLLSTSNNGQHRGALPVRPRGQGELLDAGHGWDGRGRVWRGKGKGRERVYGRVGSEGAAAAGAEGATGRRRANAVGV